MADRSRTTLRGFLVQDPRYTPASILAASSSFTQDGPHAGVPVTSPTTSKLVMEATGTMTASTTITLQTLVSGLADEGSYAWRTASTWYGWDTPITIGGWECIEWCGPAPAQEREALYPSIARTSTGRLLVVAQTLTVVLGVSTYRVRARYLSGGAWANSPVYSLASVTDGLFPALLVDGDRVLCASVHECGATAQIRIDHSDNDGATWTNATRRALRAPIDTSGAPGAGAAGYAIRRVKWAKSPSQWLLLVGVTANNTTLGQRDETWQYASLDGVLFSYIGKLDGNEGSACFDVVWASAQSVFVVVAICSDLGAEPMRPHAYRVPSAYSPFADWAQEGIHASSTATYWASWAGGTMTDGDIALAAAPGLLYVAGRFIGQDHDCVIAVSVDSGLALTTWTPLSHSPAGDAAEEHGAYGAWWICGDTATHPSNLAMAWDGSGLAVVHNWAASPGTNDNSLGIAYLGRSTSVTLPSYYTDGTGQWWDQACFVMTWLPFDLPGDCGWTATVAGTETLDAGYLELDSAGGAVWYYVTLAGTMDEGSMARAWMIPVAAGSDIAPDMILRLRYGDGAAWYQVVICISTAGFRVWDETTGNDLSGLVAPDMSDGILFELHLAGGYCSCYYSLEAPGAAKRTKVPVVSGTAVGDGGAGVATSRCEWGHRSGAACQSQWALVAVSSDEWTGGTLAAGQSAPTGLQGRPFTSQLDALTEGAIVRLAGGPPSVGDTATIATAYDYPIEAIFPSVRRSPRDYWQAEDDTHDQVIVLELSDLVADSAPGNDMIGLWFQGIDWDEVTISRGSGAPIAWTALGTLYASSGLSGLHFVRTGNTVQGDGSTVGPYIHEGEFAGGSFMDDTGNVRRILHNTEGTLGSGGGKQASLILEGALVTDDTAGTAGAIRPPWMAVIIKLGGVDYRALKISIPAQATVEGKIRIGTLVAGWVAVFGAETSWGRTLSTERNSAESEAGDWTSAVQVRAPARRIIEMGWPDGVDTTGSYSGNPDYVLDKAGGVAVASLPGTPWMVEGLSRSLLARGQVGALLTAIPYDGNAPIVLNRRWQGMLAESITDVTIDTVLGEEGSTELVRIAKQTYREVV